jgi:tetratricopeptide (TPR) repeat protein
MNDCRTLHRGLNTALIALLVLLFTVPVYAQEYKQSFNDGVEAAKAKDLQSAVDHFSAAAAGAKTEGDADVERKANGYISKIEYSFGLSQMKKEAYDEALVHFEIGIEKDPAYPKNYLARAKALKKKGDTDAAIAAYAESALRAEEAGDSKTARTAKQAIRDHFIFLASSALSRNGARTTRADADEALEALMTLQNFVPDEDADVLYYMAEIHKVNGEYQTAVQVADQALELHRGSRVDKAKIYYVKGEALMALGNNPGAKEAFAGASFGSYKASAQHYIETLGTNN